MNNCYIPQKAKIIEVIRETKSNLNIKTFRVQFLEEGISFKPGQFAEVTVFGVGEAPFCIASSPTEKDYIEFSIKETGLVTGTIHNLNKGDIIGSEAHWETFSHTNRLKGKTWYL